VTHPERLVIGGDFWLSLGAATDTMAILGRRGSGKTHTAKVLAEEMLAHHLQVIVIDPLDVWWGLRALAGGEGPSDYPIYIFGGEHADLDLHDTAGALLAETAVESGESMVLSLRHLSKGGARRFVGEFCERLYELKGKARTRGALHLFIDEADAFVPQRLQPDGMRCFGAVDTIVRRGRSSGLATTLISQRPAVLNKDVLSQTEILICHQITGPQDRKALDAWIEANDDANLRPAFLKGLASLPKGTAWFWSPSLAKTFEKVPVRELRTFDSSSTPTAGSRKKAGAKAQLAAVDLTILGQRMTEVAEQQKANDPSALKRRIAELERMHTAALQVPGIDPKVHELALSHIRAWRELVAGAERLLEQVANFTHSMKTLASVTQMDPAHYTPPKYPPEVFKPVADYMARADKSAAALQVNRQFPGETTMERRQAVTRASDAKQRGDMSLGKAERAILTVLAQVEGAIPRDRLAMRAGYAPSGGGFGNAISKLRVASYIEGSSELAITSAGRKALGTFETLPSPGEKLLVYWEAKLGLAERKILRELATCPERALPRDIVAQRTGYAPSGGGFGNALSRLRTLGLIIGFGELTAMPDLCV
jgi:SpoVK/Ycf46/Vps4 family AAA+-type ATPase